MKGKGKRRTGEQVEKEKRKRRTVTQIVNKKDFKGTLVSFTFVLVYLYIFKYSVTDVYVSIMQH